MLRRVFCGTGGGPDLGRGAEDARAAAGSGGGTDLRADSGSLDGGATAGPMIVDVDGTIGPGDNGGGGAVVGGPLVGGTEGSGVRGVCARCGGELGPWRGTDGSDGARWRISGLMDGSTPPVRSHTRASSGC